MNEIMNVKEVIAKPLPLRELTTAVRKLFPNFENIYSYVLYNNDNNYTIIFHVSEYDKYNCIDVNCAKLNIINAIIHNNKKRGIISYEQPPLAILIKVLKPLTHSLAKQEYRHWSKQLSFEDIEQICQLSICELYNKGYYIHKSLIARALKNAIYQFLRADDRRGFKVVSLYAKQFADEENLVLLDTIEDETASSIIENKELNAVKNDIFNEQKELIIDMIGQRQYDQLVREWTMNSTTNASRRRIQSLKREIESNGLSGKAWVIYYE